MARVRRLATVAQERRWDVIFLTKHPETVGVVARVQSQRWLEARGFTLLSVYASTEMMTCVMSPATDTADVRHGGVAMVKEKPFYRRGSSALRKARRSDGPPEAARWTRAMSSVS